MTDRQPAADLRNLTILYVEDEEAIRAEAVYFLERRAGTVLTAANGREGLDLYFAAHPDIVVTDIQMPLMTGLEMAAEIKKANRETPIILTTAFSNTHYLQQAITLGLDGYVQKPINLDYLMQAIFRSVEILMQSREIAISRTQLSAYHRAAEDERRLVADLMTRMMRPERLQDRQLQFWLQPTELIGGDLVAAARGRGSKFYVMLADSTGHGLPAALNLLPINHIFYSMVSKNLPVSLIVEEMNWAVHDQSPIDRFVAATVVAIDTRNRMVEIWNGGPPDVHFVDNEGNIARSFPSANLPLGILDRTFVAETEIYQWPEGGRLVMYTDGLEDAENDAGEAFGRKRIIDVIKSSEPGQLFDNLKDGVTTHLAGRNAFDDMTLAVVDCNPRSQAS